jgi:hypothetical protein
MVSSSDYMTHSDLQAALQDAMHCGLEHLFAAGCLCKLLLLLLCRQAVMCPRASP